MVEEELVTEEPVVEVSPADDFCICFNSVLDFFFLLNSHTHTHVLALFLFIADRYLKHNSYFLAKIATTAFPSHIFLHFSGIQAAGSSLVSPAVCLHR